jgi:hypothetical protein
MSLTYKIQFQPHRERNSYPLRNHLVLYRQVLIVGSVEFSPVTVLITGRLRNIGKISGRDNIFSLLSEGQTLSEGEPLSFSKGNGESFRED